MLETYFFDAPVVLDCSVTPIPGSSASPLQVVAKLSDQVTRLVINDAVGDYVGVYSGAIGQEQLRAIVCSGKIYTVPVILSGGVRVSLRAIGASAISTGNLCITFVSGRLE